MVELRPNRRPAAEVPLSSDGGVRTHDLSIMSRALSPTELRRHDPHGVDPQDYLRPRRLTRDYRPGIADDEPILRDSGQIVPGSYPAAS